MIKTLRGQPVDVDSKTKTVSVTIYKPLLTTFSLSDKIVEYLKKNYRIKVYLPDKECILTPQDKPFRVESVPSKFENLRPWHRHWFSIPRVSKAEREQMRLF
jgi:hypothetical protein